MKVHCIPKNEWREMAENAHLVVFGEKLPETQVRCDFTLLVVNDADEPQGYVTCREIDAETLYFSYGGAFPSSAKSLPAWRAYQALHEKAFTLGVNKILTYIENTNSPMLKFAMKMGYKIIGVKMHDGIVLLEHRLEKTDA